MSNTIWIVPIEPIDQRYTKQWYDNIPGIIEDAIKTHGKDYVVYTIDGVAIPPNTTTGAFLDFGATNVYKASQTEVISRMFSSGEIKPGDKFLVTDAWNFVITPIKYMSDLLDIPVEIHGIWHAGAYDPTDILGYKMQKPWPAHQERAWFYCCDYNYYATNFHMNMFLKNLSIPKEDHTRAFRSGQPHTPIVDMLTPFWDTPKDDAIIWPHRYNADKQPEMIENMAPHLNGEVIITQKLDLSKQEYYETMGRMKIIVSQALHENLGISMMEGVLAGAIPIVPDRASYHEMYMDCFKYPSEWTSSWENYLANRHNLIEFINESMLHYNEIKETSLLEQREILINDYLKPNVMINKLLGK